MGRASPKGGCRAAGVAGWAHLAGGEQLNKVGESEMVDELVRHVENIVATQGESPADGE